MNKEEKHFSKDFFKQFKTAGELEDFFRELYKEGAHSRGHIVRALKLKYIVITKNRSVVLPARADL